MRAPSICCALSFVLVLAAGLCAQAGDRPGETQALLPDSVAVPAAVVRTPAEELATFEVAPGCRVELFASEPLLHDPVAAQFDAGGRLWVVEMRSYMNDIDASTEGAPTGRIVVLHDDDRDGRADRSTVFADGLVLPRAVLPLSGGALVITPPELVWMPDADGDLVADGSREVVMGGFEAGLANPEHCGNGLVWGLDHRIHLANDKRLVRRVDGRFVVEQGSGGGQWGISHDDRGRFYFNYNSDWLHCDLVPGHYAAAADAVGGVPALNARMLRDTSVWPIRITPGVNRGYQKGVLRDWVLASHTAVCGPAVYRGDWLPFDGDVFVCEPAGNCVRRIVLRDVDGPMVGDNAYQAEQREFLASTDERFRPVNLLNGPDGALYVVDFYRGVIQHKVFVTSFLRHQIEKRGLIAPVGLGRIWRVVPDSPGLPKPWPNLQEAGRDALVDALGHGSGAVRDLALRELVERRLLTAAPQVRQRCSSDARPAVRIVGLSALAGLGGLSQGDLRAALRDEDPGVLAFALQHAGPWLARGDGMMWAAVERLADASPASVRWHLALALGDARRAPGPRRGDVAERALAMLASLVRAQPDDANLRAVVAAAAHPAVPSVLDALCVAFGAEPSKAQVSALRDFALRAAKGRNATAQVAVLDIAARAVGPRLAAAVLSGLVGAMPKGDRQQGWLVFPATPPSLAALAQHADEVVRGHATTLLAAVRIEGAVVPGAVTSLTADEAARVRAGEQVFGRSCAACHQLDGKGQRGLAPPLADSEWVVGPPDRLVRIALHGVKGPIEVDGETWSLEMPGHGAMSDRELAQVLSYLRRAFGHQASCVDEASVAATRAATRGRGEAWTAAELLGTK